MTAAPSPRELQVLQLVAAGATNKEIARELGIGYQTVLQHLRGLRVKLDTNPRCALVTAGFRAGLLA